MRQIPAEGYHDNTFQDHFVNCCRKENVYVQCFD